MPAHNEHSINARWVNIAFSGDFTKSGWSWRLPWKYFWYLVFYPFYNFLFFIKEIKGQQWLILKTLGYEMNMGN